MPNAQQRAKALSLYRAILRAARTRFGAQPEEREAIYDEASTLFRRNAHLTDRDAIDAKLFEAESRLELALHYGIPHARLYYLNPGATPHSPRRVAHAKYMDTYCESLQPDGYGSNAPPVDRPPQYEDDEGDPWESRGTRANAR